MGISNARIPRLDGGAVGRKARNAVYLSASAPPIGAPRPDRHGGSFAGPAVARRLRELAASGDLPAAAAEGSPYRTALTGAAYDLVWPIVFARLTRRFEMRRGHPRCAIGVANLADECLDRFHDDVEAVVDDLLTNARQPIHRLEAWVAARLGAATTNAYRRRRGERGALQRPRMPGWLADALGLDMWLTTLATNILDWVGVGGTAGERTWPLEAWAQDRGACTGDWLGSDRATVGREIDQVLAAMRRRPDWYESFVERPLGAKRAPVVSVAADVYGEPMAPLVPTGPDEQVESELQRLAGDAVRAIGDRIRRGEAAEPAVVEVIHTVFGGVLRGTLDQAPHGIADPLGGITGALSDRRRVDAIVSTALHILDERDS